MSFPDGAAREGKTTKYDRLIRMRPAVVAFLLVLWTTCTIVTQAWSADTDKLVIDLDAVQINVTMGLDAKFKNVSLSGNFFGETYPVNEWEWEVEQYTPNTYRVRRLSWRPFFWDIDCEQKTIRRMKGSDLKSAGSEAEPLDGITVKDIRKGNGPTGQTISITLAMTSPQLFVNQPLGDVMVVAGGVVVSDANAWEGRRVNNDLYHFRLRMPHEFWQINTTAMTLERVAEGRFGSPGGRTFRLPGIIHSDGSSAQSDTLFDITFRQYRGDHPKSPWQESEKALNGAVLSKGSYDTLVVPFQVSGFAIDRLDRSLMTRYLNDDLERSTKLKFPSPTLVARALGETSRTFNEDDVFQLANRLGVKQIIRGYVGHDRNERMNVTLVVQTRNEGEHFSSGTKTVRYSWHELAISDVRTPAEAFVDILHDISVRLGIPASPQKNNQNYQAETTPAFPSEPRGLVIDSSASPLVRAYYLQLLGMLYPEQSTAKEELFERSLVVLREMSPQAPGYKVLKARALFYLHRRPAAVAVMAAPKGAEEKALSAVMDGDLQSLDKNIEGITGPLPRLIAHIERSDLHLRYSRERTVDQIMSGFMSEWPGWELILTRRLNHADPWTLQSNLDIKKELDRLFPLTGFTTEDIIRSKIAIGELPMDDDDVDFSVYNHYRRMMENQPEKLMVNEFNQVVERDILDLLVGVGESNLLKTIRLRQAQALYDEMIKLVDRYSAIYGGHPEMSFLKATALYGLARSKQGQVQKHLRQEASQIQSNVCYWSQGQTEVASRRTCVGTNYYDADYPRRWYWDFSAHPQGLTDREYLDPQEFTKRGTNTLVTPYDRKEIINYELSLLYTQADFSPLSSCFEKLQHLQMNEEANALLEKNRHRFIGNPLRTTFFASVAEKEGDLPRASAIYKEALALQPNDWALYRGLSSLLIRQGEFTTASKTALQYPLFSLPHAQREAIDTVSLSNYAFDAGNSLWRSGATDEARPLLQLSAGYETGSGAEMLSTTFLALLEQDFQKAAQVSLLHAKRYNKTSAYGDYMELLHVMGYQDQAWAVLPQMQSGGYAAVKWNPVLIGLRLEGKTLDEQIQWLKKQPENSSISQDAAEFTFLAHTLDRKPETNLSGKLKTFVPEAPKVQVKPPPGVKLIQAGDPQFDKMQAELLKKHGNPLQPLADGYAFLKTKNFKDAYEVLKIRFLDEPVRKDMFSYAISYLAWSGAKSGNASVIESYLSTYRKQLEDDFDYYLSEAFLSASRKNNKEAIRNLESARYHVRQVSGKRLLPAWYQLAETCEWLYEDSKFEGYRELLLKFVKLHQTIRPMDSWAYAFEAKYTKSDSDRTKALAITLYLDKESERIAHLPEREKSKALEWIKNNNPFLKAKRNGPRRET